MLADLHHLPLGEDVKTLLCGLLGGVLVLGAVAMPATALAQTEQEFVAALAGGWEAYDDVYALEGKKCRITLKTDKAGSDHALVKESCGLELGMVTAWRIVEGQLALVADDGVIAVLGGNRFRMSGNSSIGAPVILDRVGENVSMANIAKAREASGCFYLGFTDTCIDETQLGKPKVPADGSAASIGVLVNLNARAEAREDAEIVGVVPANSCIVTEVCSMAADGVWCRARFGEATGWLKKLALRQERWPVVTFVNQCQSK